MAKHTENTTSSQDRKSRDPFEGHVERIRRRLHQIQKHLKEEDCASYARGKKSPVRGECGEPCLFEGGAYDYDYQGVISIVGERGNGKSTLLRKAAQALCDQGAVVLPILKPEMFLASTSLVAVVAEYLDLFLKPNLPDDEWESGCVAKSGARSDTRVVSCRANENAGMKDKLRRDLRKLQIADARGQQLFFQNLSSSSATGEEFGEQFRDAQRHVIERYREFVDWVARFLCCCAEWRGKRGSSGDDFSRFLVIPLDDSDLFPSMLPRMVADIAFLARSSQVIILTAFAADAMKRGIKLLLLTPSGGVPKISGRQVDRHDLFTTQELNRECDEFMRKVFPVPNRVDVTAPSDLMARLHFTPLGNQRDQDLAALMGKIPLERWCADSIVTLRSLFDLDGLVSTSNGRNDRLTPCAELLPTSMRGLDHLYRQLKPLSEDSSDRDDRSVSPARIAEIVLANALQSGSGKMDWSRLVSINMVAGSNGEGGGIHTRFSSSTNVELVNSGQDALFFYIANSSQSGSDTSLTERWFSLNLPKWRLIEMSEGKPPKRTILPDWEVAAATFVQQLQTFKSGCSIKAERWLPSGGKEIFSYPLTIRAASGVHFPVLVFPDFRSFIPLWCYETAWNYWARDMVSVTSENVQEGSQSDTLSCLIFAHYWLIATLALQRHVKLEDASIRPGKKMDNWEIKAQEVLTGLSDWASGEDAVWQRKFLTDLLCSVAYTAIFGPDKAAYWAKKSLGDWAGFFWTLLRRDAMLQSAFAEDLGLVYDWLKKESESTELALRPAARFYEKRTKDILNELIEQGDRGEETPVFCRQLASVLVRPDETAAPTN